MDCVNVLPRDGREGVIEISRASHFKHTQARAEQFDSSFHVANLHLRFGLSFTLVGLTVACFGIGGLIYSGLVRLLVYRLGQIGLTVIGGFVITAAYVVLVFQPAWWFAPIAVTAIGLGFYMFHNTLQTKATQMTPEARGTAVALFSSALYFGQTAGVAVGALVIDRLGAEPLFLGTAVAFPALAIWFAHQLRWRQPSG